MKPSEILRRNIGGEKADAVLAVFNKWVGGMREYKGNGPVSKSNQIDGYDYKAHTTTVDGAGGFLIPLEIKAEVCRVINDVGYILAAASKVIVHAGQSVRVNELKTMSTLALRCGECVDIPEVTTELDTPDELKPCFVGGVYPASNELVNYPGVNFSDLFFNWMVEAIVAVEEWAILQASKAGGASHDGILVDPTVFAAPDFDPAVAGGLAKTLLAAASHSSHLGNPTTTMVVGPPTIYLMEASIGGSSGGFVCGTAGTVPRFNCFRTVGTDSVHLGTDNWLAIFDPRHVVVATDQNVVMDINPYENFTKNCSMIKVGQYFDFVLCHAETMAKAKVKKPTP